MYNEETPLSINKTLMALIEDEEVGTGLTFENQTITEFDLSSLEVSDGQFHKIVCTQARLGRTCFYGTTFKLCDFSNSTFDYSYFSDCTFVDCKFVGANFKDSTFKKCNITASNFNYTNFDGSKLSDLKLLDSNFSNASFSSVKFKKITIKDSKFIQNNFFATSLKGMDFSKTEFLSPTVSTEGGEFKGMSISAMQAVELISIFGITIK